MSDAMELTRYRKIRPPRPSRKSPQIVMRLSSLNEFNRREKNSYLLIQRPSGRHWNNPSLGERLHSRPPLEVDLESPTPSSYQVQVPAPAVHGTKINPRSRYTRDVLPNPTKDVWTYNISAHATVPGPLTYASHNVFGQKCPIVRQAPAFSLTPRRSEGKERDIPGPDSYDSARSREQTLTRFPAFSMATRDNPKSMHPSPGPAHYHPLHGTTHHQSPAFSMRPKYNSKSSTF